MPSELACGDGFGELRSRVVAGGVQLSESRYGAGETVPSHYHRRPQVCVVLEGGYEERYQGTTLRGVPGATFFHAPGEIHENCFSERGGACFHVDVDPALLPSGAQEGGALETGFSRRTSPGWHAFKLRGELHHPDDVSLLAVEALALDLFAHVLKVPGLAAAPGPSWLKQVRDHVHEEYRTPPTLAALAERAGVHRVTVAQAFRRHFRCTVGEYVRQRRVEVAVRRLLDSETRLSELAYEAGFADQSHLTRTFRRLVGTTPGAFQRRFARPPPRDRIRS